MSGTVPQTGTTDNDEEVKVHQGSTQGTLLILGCKKECVRFQQFSYGLRFCSKYDMIFSIAIYIDRY